MLTCSPASVWRPINGVVDNFPLALMDYRSLSPNNVHPCNLWRHQYEQRGQTMAFSYAEGQKWYYLKAQRVDEVTMIKIWDSKEDVVGKRKFVIPKQVKGFFVNHNYIGKWLIKGNRQFVRMQRLTIQKRRAMRHRGRVSRSDVSLYSTRSNRRIL